MCKQQEEVSLGESVEKGLMRRGEAHSSPSRCGKGQRNHYFWQVFCLKDCLLEDGLESLGGGGWAMCRPLAVVRALRGECSVCKDKEHVLKL